MEMFISKGQFNNFDTTYSMVQDYMLHPHYNIPCNNGFINQIDHLTEVAYMNNHSVRGSPREVSPQINYILTADSVSMGCNTAMTHGMQAMTYSTKEYFGGSAPCINSMPLDISTLKPNQNGNSKPLTFVQQPSFPSIYCGEDYQQIPLMNKSPINDSAQSSQNKLESTDLFISNKSSTTDEETTRGTSCQMKKHKRGSGRKEAHNLIERRYRDTLNQCYSRLESTVFNGDSKETGTHTKAVILKSANEHIIKLDAENARLLKENLALKERLNSAYLNPNENSYKYPTNGSVPFFVRGNNSSKNIIIFIITFISIFIYNLDSVGYPIVPLPAKSSLPYGIIFLTIICWVYLNREAQYFEDGEPIISYPNSLNEQKKNIKFMSNSVTTSSFFNPLCALDYNLLDSVLRTISAYVAFLPNLLMTVDDSTFVSGTVIGSIGISSSSFSLHDVTEYKKKTVEESYNALYFQERKCASEYEYPMNKLTDFSHVFQTQFEMDLYKLILFLQVSICIYNEIVMTLRNDHVSGQMDSKKSSTQQIIKERLVLYTFFSKLNFPQNKVTFRKDKCISKFCNQHFYTLARLNKDACN